MVSLFRIFLNDNEIITKIKNMTEEQLSNQAGKWDLFCKTNYVKINWKVQIDCFGIKPVKEYTISNNFNQIFPNILSNS